MFNKRLISSFLATIGGAAMIFAASPRYVFYFIGDGMGWGAVSAAQLFHKTGLEREGNLMMFDMPVAGSATTYSASSPVTDSAAAGTALATGYKTNNGMLGVTPDSVSVTSIASVLHNSGWGVGLVTTVAPDDATPGAFYAHVPSRSMFYEIGCDAAASGYEFIAGANLRGMKDKSGKPNDLLNVFERNGVKVVRGIAELEDVDSRRVLLLNTDTLSAHSNDVGLNVDSIAGILTLPEMTDACLNHLLKNAPEHFFMMVEGGSIDHAGHSNDVAASVNETVAFDNSLRIAYEFYKKHPEETLIVVTADHETGGLAVANRGMHYYADFKVLSKIHSSKDRFAEYLRSVSYPMSWDEMQTVLTERFSLYGELTPEKANDQEIRKIFEETFGREMTQKERDNASWAFSDAVMRAIDRLAGAGWTTGDHSGAVVPVFAAGCDADRFTGVMDNTEIPKTIMEIIGIK